MNVCDTGNAHVNGRRQEQRTADQSVDRVRVSVVLPCLNEADTVAKCVGEAFRGLRTADVNGEVIVCDNGSTDCSREVASEAGATVVHCRERGYGAALRCGIDSATGDIVVMADADGTYDLANLRPFITGLLKQDETNRRRSPGYTFEEYVNEPLGADVVLGNRFRGGIERDAMPWSHRYVGVPGLTSLLNWLFGTSVGDSQCGIRSFTREAYTKICPRSTGMEFASELLARAAHLGLVIHEVPTVLRCDAVGRRPHLRSIRDGLRNLRLLISVWIERWSWTAGDGAEVPDNSNGTPSLSSPPPRRSPKIGRPVERLRTKRYP